MRLFLAADIDDETRAQMAETCDLLQTHLNEAATPPRVAWVRGELAHVTLRFIGEAPEEMCGALERALSDALPLSPFDVRWERLGTFPGSRRPRVIWVGPDAGHAQLSALASAVNTAIAALVGPGESRPFRAHLTLGRVKEAGRQVDWAAALAAVPWRPTTTRVDHVTLYRSRLSSKGPTYTAVWRVPL